MTVATQDIALGTGEHVVQFYERDSELTQIIGEHLADAIRSDRVAVVIATDEHHRAFESNLAAAGIDPDGVIDPGTLVELDAAATLAEFMPYGKIDSEAFRRVVGSVIRRAAETGRPVWAFGEMVSLLWDADDVLAAIELETLWNELGREIPFSLWCAYRRSSVSGSEHAEALQRICHLHSAVVHSDDRLANDKPMAIEVSRNYAAEPGTPRAARHFLADALRKEGHGDEVLDDAQLILSELATNAVIHARSAFAVVARAQDSTLRISVRDSSPVEPELLSSPRSGRGLQIVAALASDWGVDRDSDGKTVWAELRTSPR